MPAPVPIRVNYENPTALLSLALAAGNAARRPREPQYRTGVDVQPGPSASRLQSASPYTVYNPQYRNEDGSPVGAERTIAGPVRGARSSAIADSVTQTRRMSTGGPNPQFYDADIPTPATPDPNAMPGTGRISGEFTDTRLDPATGNFYQRRGGGAMRPDGSTDISQLAGRELVDPVTGQFNPGVFRTPIQTTAPQRVQPRGVQFTPQGTGPGVIDPYLLDPSISEEDKTFLRNVRDQFPSLTEEQQQRIVDERVRRSRPGVQDGGLSPASQAVQERFETTQERLARNDALRAAQAQRTAELKNLESERADLEKRLRQSNPDYDPFLGPEQFDTQEDLSWWPTGNTRVPNEPAAAAYRRVQELNQQIDQLRRSPAPAATQPAQGNGFSIQRID